MTTKDKWLLHGPPGAGDYLVFGFPYAGVGASSYREWPRTIGTGRFCPLQPPGKENRSKEAVPVDHAAFAEQLLDSLAPHLDRPYALIGHCGAFPYMLSTTQRIQALGLPLPRRLFASSWGAPQRGLYGRLNFVDLDTVDMVAEIQDIGKRLGRPVMPELAELSAEFMLDDLRVQRGYRYDGVERVPVPVTVLGWTEDDVVPADGVFPGWTECADATYQLLPGDHGAFLRAPDVLRELIEHEMTAGPAGRADQEGELWTVDAITATR
jgi:surfactin synthase thioesterase subunit